MTKWVIFKGLAAPLSFSPSQHSGTARRSGNMGAFQRNSVQLLTVFALNVEMWFQVRMTCRHWEKIPALADFFFFWLRIPTYVICKSDQTLWSHKNRNWESQRSDHGTTGCQENLRLPANRTEISKIQNIGRGEEKGFVCNILYRERKTDRRRGGKRKKGIQ